MLVKLSMEILLLYRLPDARPLHAAGNFSQYRKRANCRANDKKLARMACSGYYSDR
jgi:hypothetical protein